MDSLIPPDVGRYVVNLLVARTTNRLGTSIAQAAMNGFGFSVVDPATALSLAKNDQFVLQCHSSFQEDLQKTGGQLTMILSIRMLDTLLSGLTTSEIACQIYIDRRTLNDVRDVVHRVLSGSVPDEIVHHIFSFLPTKSVRGLCKKTWSCYKKYNKN
jgi:hypothetical protein